MGMEGKICKRALVVALADISGNPRPRRMVSLLREKGFEVAVACFPLKGALDVSQYYKIESPNMAFHMRICRRILNIVNSFVYIPWVRNFQDHLRLGVGGIAPILNREKFDLVVVEDLYLLPFAYQIQDGAKILFDAREYYPSQYEHSLLWRLTEKRAIVELCRNFLPRCDAVMTVSQGLQSEYKKSFNVEPSVVRSLPYYADVKPVRNSEKIRMVHHGVANRNRKLENMIRMFQALDDRFELDFYLVGNRPYVEKLCGMAAGIDRIQFKEPVEFDQIIPTFKEYDVGLCFIEATTFNLKHALPNKLFEYIQARLMVVSGPSPDMAEIVVSHGLGVVVPDFSPEALAGELNLLSRDTVNRYKNASDVAAHELCYEKESAKVGYILDNLGVLSGGLDCTP